MKNLLAVFLHATSHPNDKIKPSYYKHTHTFSSMFPLHFVPVTFFLSYHITCYIQHFFFVFFPLFCVSFYHQNPSQNGMEVEYCLISFSSHLSLSFFPAMLLNLSLFLFTFYLFFLSGYFVSFSLKLRYERSYRSFDEFFQSHDRKVQSKI